MSTGGSAKAGNGAPVIPPAAKRVVISLREIVNCSEHEIYAMLRECDMDPNETVSRLLSQATFQEVKSKKERKKENKDSSDTKSRVSNASSNRGYKNMADRSGGRSSFNHVSPNSDFGQGRTKPSMKKDIGGGFPAPLINSAPNREFISTDGNRVPTGTTLSISAPSPPPEYQSAWAGLPPGQLSMADIVKRGRPQNRPPILPTSNPVQTNVMQPSAFPSLPAKPLHNQAVFGSSISGELGDFECSAAADGSMTLMNGQTDIRLTSGTDEALISEDNKSAKHQMPFSLEDQPEEDNLNNLSHFEDNSYESHDYLEKNFEHPEAPGGSSHLHSSDYPKSPQIEDVSVEVSIAAADLQQLSLREAELRQPSVPLHAEDNPAVVMPNHFQHSSTDCAHLSFGSFGSGMSAASFSGPSPNKNLKQDYVDSVLAANASHVEHSDVRKGEYYGNDDFSAPASHENADVPSSRPEILTQDSASESLQGQAYTFPTASSYGFEDAARPSVPGVSAVQTNPHMHSLPHLSSVMQPYPVTLPNALLSTAVHPGRELDVPYSQFTVTQSMPTKVPSMSGSTLSVPEGTKANILSTHHLATQALPNSNIAQGSVVPQHLPVHPYSPNLPLSHFTNMISYPFMPQNYPYLPYATGSSAFHQSPATVASAAGLKYHVPQFKNSVSGGSLPQAGSIASGYGGSFGNATNVSNFNNLNVPNSVSSTHGYDDMLSQFKEGNHYVSLQQNDGSNSWVHGPSSRTMATFPPSTYYSFQNQNQPSGFRQGQQPSPYGNLGYPNFYHSQPTLNPQEHPTPSDGTVVTSQGPSSQQSHQLWQHSY